MSAADTPKDTLKNLLKSAKECIPGADFKGVLKHCQLAIQLEKKHKYELGDLLYQSHGVRGWFYAALSSATLVLERCRSCLDVMRGCLGGTMLLAFNADACYRATACDRVATDAQAQGMYVLLGHACTQLGGVDNWNEADKAYREALKIQSLKDSPLAWQVRFGEMHRVMLHINRL